ncbi:MAG: type II toxin-antitoxin system VapC family toxin [Acidimicrobiales bacterium]
MILLDTHAWLWLRSDPDRLSVAARDAASREQTVVASISCWELVTLARLGRVSLDRDAGPWISHALAAQPAVEAIKLTTGIAVSAGELGGAFPGDPADRVIYATARSLGCRLVTKDRRIRRFAPDDTIWD